MYLFESVKVSTSNLNILSTADQFKSPPVDAIRIHMIPLSKKIGHDLLTFYFIFECVGPKLLHVPGLPDDAAPLRERHLDPLCQPNRALLRPDSTDEVGSCT